MNQLSLGIFPYNTKIAKVTPIFKSRKRWLLTNYRPIPVLPRFSKIIQKIMYNRVYKYLDENSILFQKQFGFRKNHCTSHALVALISSIYNSFNQNKFRVGVFIYLSKVFIWLIMILFNKRSLHHIKNKS